MDAQDRSNTRHLVKSTAGALYRSARAADGKAGGRACSLIRFAVLATFVGIDAELVHSSVPAHTLQLTLASALQRPQTMTLTLMRTPSKCAAQNESFRVLRFALSIVYAEPPLHRCKPRTVQMFDVEGLDELDALLEGGSGSPERKEAAQGAASPTARASASMGTGSAGLSGISEAGGEEGAGPGTDAAHTEATSRLSPPRTSRGAALPHAIAPGRWSRCGCGRCLLCDQMRSGRCRHSPAVTPRLRACRCARRERGRGSAAFARGDAGARARAGHISSRRRRCSGSAQHGSRCAFRGLRGHFASGGTVITCTRADLMRTCCSQPPARARRRHPEHNHPPRLS